MRKLVLILMGLIAVSTFISAYNYPPPHASGDAAKKSMDQNKNH